jgi:hypothetical protein
LLFLLYFTQFQRSKEKEMNKQYPYGTPFSMKVTASVHILADIGAAVLEKWPRDVLQILIAMSRGEINALVARGLIGQIMAAYAQQSFAERSKMWGFVYYPTPYHCVKITDPHEDKYVFVEAKDGDISFRIHGLTGICRAVRKAAGYGDGVVTFEALAYPSSADPPESIPGRTPREIYQSLQNCGEWTGSEPKWDEA